jgi:hypothetical protein
MTNEERDLIARFIGRVGGAPQTGGFLTGGGGSVPATQAAMPPIDREADSFIAQQFQQYPEARYRITQMAVVTEAALAEAQNRIKRLEWELEQTKNAAQQAFQQQGQQQGQQQAQPQQSGGFFSNIFGGGQQQRPAYAQPGYGQPGPQQGQPVWGNNYQPTSPPPQPQYAPGYQPGMFQRGGSGFLGSALTTAAGVAGGMVVGNALMGMFEGHHGGESFGGGGFGGGGFGGGGFGAGGEASAGSPWGSAASDPGSNPFDGGGVLPTSDPTAGFGSPDTSSSDPFAGSGAPDSSWDQASGGGFDDSSGGGFDGGGFDDNNT